jgi:intracellular multiplication protein IcmL
MALEEKKQTYIPRENNFYRKHYHHILYGLMGLLVLVIMALSLVFYQIMHKPLPQFNAMQPDGKRMLLIPYDEPNLLPNTILKWASKAATVSYTFDFVSYNQQIAAARPYFTEAGWQDYLRSVDPLIKNIVQNKLFIYGVVSGQPVINNQGELPGKGYVWRIVIPFLVTYQSENTSTKQSFYVVLSVVRVPTSVNKQGIGIDQFVMV